jgi:5-deoxy-D-glucuronate isomerase
LRIIKFSRVKVRYKTLDKIKKNSSEQMQQLSVPAEAVTVIVAGTLAVTKKEKRTNRIEKPNPTFKKGNSSRLVTNYRKVVFLNLVKPMVGIPEAT